MNVLLTGATGFLGGRLCLELLRRTESRVYCLVRGKSAEGAERRLLAKLTSSGATPEQLARVVTVSGDFTVPRFGLTPTAYDELADRIGAVYHCGAWVSMVADRDRLVPANVAGTAEVIAFAAHGRSKALHHISSIAAFSAARSAGIDVVDESTMPHEEYACGVGYARTKLAAEQLAHEAGASGVPVTVYRPGIILGDSGTGHCPESDVEVRLIRGVVELGLAPECPGSFPASPVDFVARAITELSQRADAAGRTFHPVHPAQVVTAEVFDHIRAFGFELGAVSIEDWERALRAQLALPSAFVLLALWEPISYLLARTPEYRLPEVRCEETTAALGFGCPDPDRAHFFRILQYLVNEGRLPAPERSRTCQSR